MPSMPSSVPTRRVTRSRIAPFGVGPSASGSSAGTRAIRASMRVIFMVAALPGILRAKKKPAWRAGFSVTLKLLLHRVHRALLSAGRSAFGATGLAAFHGALRSALDDVGHAAALGSIRSGSTARRSSSVLLLILLHFVGLGRVSHRLR